MAGSPCSPRPIGLHELVRGLRELGVVEGDRLIVHASLSSFGSVIGGAHTIIDALLAVLGPSGTLLVPYFPSPFYPGPYDPVAPPPAMTGALSNAAREWPGAVMSFHPSHPVVATGPDARELTRDHHRVSAVGVNSPEDRLAKLGGKVLLLGVTQRKNTTIHTGEAYAAAPYWGQPRPDRPAGRWMILPGAGKTWVSLSETPGDSAGFDKIEPFLIDQGLIAFGQIGRARCRLMDGQPLVDAVVEFLSRYPGGLLCDEPYCGFCVWARQFLPLPGRLPA
ncbi:MAG: AAC(3) family N-acetyltransferase [Anaerolineae bacterium]